MKDDEIKYYQPTSLMAFGPANKGNICFTGLHLWQKRETCFTEPPREQKRRIITLLSILQSKKGRITLPGLILNKKK